jgi:hypothetical protein
MIAKLAAFVLAASLAALTVARAVDLVGYFVHRGDAERREVVRARVVVEADEARAEAEEARAEAEVARAEAEAAAAEARDVGSEAGDTYIFDESGDALGKFPWSAHAELELRPGGRYELRIRTNLENEMEEETSWGRYRLRGDRLILSSASDHDQHEFRIDGDKLLFEADWKERIALKAVGVTKTYMERQSK